MLWLIEANDGASTNGFWQPYETVLVSLFSLEFMLKSNYYTHVKMTIAKNIEYLVVDTAFELNIRR